MYKKKQQQITNTKVSFGHFYKISVFSTLALCGEYLIRCSLAWLLLGEAHGFKHIGSFKALKCKWTHRHTHMYLYIYVYIDLIFSLFSKMFPHMTPGIDAQLK